MHILEAQKRSIETSSPPSRFTVSHDGIDTRAALTQIHIPTPVRATEIIPVSHDPPGTGGGEYTTHLHARPALVLHTRGAWRICIYDLRAHLPRGGHVATVIVVANVLTRNGMVRRHVFYLGQLGG